MSAKPRDELVKAKLVCIVEGSEKNVDLLGIRCKTRTVNSEKRICGGKSGPLVAVGEGMILLEALPEGGGFLDQVGVMTSLWSVVPFNSCELGAPNRVDPESRDRRILLGLRHLKTYSRDLRDGLRQATLI